MQTTNQVSKKFAFELSTLPNDIILEIMINLPDRALFSLIRTSKHFYELAGILQLMWKLRLNIFFGMKQAISQPTPSKNWKNEYIQNVLGKWHNVIVQMFETRSTFMKAIIYSPSGNVLGRSLKFELSDVEFQDIRSYFTAPKGTSVRVHGVRYLILSGTNNEIIFKKGDSMGCALFTPSNYVIVGVLQTGHRVWNEREIVEHTHSLAETVRVQMIAAQQ